MSDAPGEQTPVPDEPFDFETLVDRGLEVFGTIQQGKIAKAQAKQAKADAKVAKAQLAAIAAGARPSGPSPLLLAGGAVALVVVLLVAMRKK